MPGVTAVSSAPTPEAARAPPPATGAAPARRCGAAPRPTVLLVASLGVFMAFVDATIVNIAFPDIARSFQGESVASLSWVLNAYNIVFAAFLLAGGKLADLLGRRRIFMVGSGDLHARVRPVRDRPDAPTR